MTIRIGAVAVGALVLAACGQAVSTDPVSVNEAPTAEARSQAEATKSGSSNSSESKSSSDRLFGHKVYSLEQAMDTEVMGLRLNMSVDEVLNAMNERGFELDLRESQKKQDLKVLIGDYQFDCRNNNSVRCRPASMQQGGAFGWLRKSSDDPLKFEAVYPLFYLDADLQPKLFSVSYSQYYGQTASPPNVIDAMIDRFGEPTLDQSSVSRDGVQTGSLSYAIQMPVPEGLIKSENDRREAEEGDFAVFKQHPVRVSRFSCLNDQYSNITEDLSADCVKALSGDSKAYWMYEALASNRKINAGTNNTFLIVANSNSRLSVELVGEVLPVAIEIERDEAQLRQRVEERKAQLEQTYDAPSDL